MQCIDRFKEPLSNPLWTILNLRAGVYLDSGQDSYVEFVAKTGAVVYEAVINMTDPKFAIR
jgi:hypothetical protein